MTISLKDAGRQAGHARPWAVAALALLLLAWTASTAQADRGGNTAVMVVPEGGHAGGLRLRAQTVDVTVSEDAQGVWADTQVWLQLSNPLTRTITMTLALPGPSLMAGDLPADLKVQVDGSPAELKPGDGPDGGPDGGQTAEVVLAGRDEVAVRLTYRQALPEKEGVATFAYPLGATKQWGNPESLRVSVSFDPSLVAEQMLGESPAPKKTGAQSLIWSWTGKPGTDIWVAFLSPSWWAKFNAARQAAIAPGAGPGAHLALADLYHHLSALPPLAFQPDLDLYARYYPAAVAELQAAAAPQSEGAAPSADQITAHGLLANLYREQADRLGRGGGDTYLDLAATEAQAAIALGGQDPALRKLAADLYLQLAAGARARGDVKAADGYLAQLAAVEPASQASTAAEDQKTARLAFAVQQLSRGDLETARQVLEETFGPDAADIPALRAPLAGQVLLAVETTAEATPEASGNAVQSAIPGHRKLRLTLADSRDPGALQALIQQVAQAWQDVPRASVEAGPDSLSVAFSFQDDRNLAEIQARLGKVLPNIPEFALMAAALAPDSLALRADQARFERVARYQEAVNLAQAADTWRQRAQEIRSASERLAANAGTPTPDPTPAQAGLSPGTTGDQPEPAPGTTRAATADLAQVQRALWAANAVAWEELVGRSSAQYSLDMAGAGQRQWQVPAGQLRMLTNARSDWVPERLLLAGAGGALFVLLLAFVVWRWL